MKDLFNNDCEKLKSKKLWLFDMDGTIYLGNKIFDGTLDLLENIEKNGGKYVFITNNSSKSKSDYIKKVKSLGIKAEKDNFYTSLDALIVILKEKLKDSLIYVQGTKSFKKNLKKEGIKITDRYNEKAKAVVVGFDTELNFKKLETTCKTLKLNLPYFATNPDFVCPTEYGYVPDCGSMCFGLEKATGKVPIYIGKPSPFMIEEVIKKFKVKKSETVVIGDRIYTDILSGINAKVDTVLVLSGESTLKDVENSKDKPKYVFKNVKKINEIFGKL